MLFQSPSLRGSGRFFRRLLFHSRYRPSFNPLHCGAVVASYLVAFSVFFISLVSIPFIAGQWSLLGDGFFGLFHTVSCFNPLHCGAVVASGIILVIPIISLFVSIPFIAGQWSLHLVVA